VSQQEERTHACRLGHPPLTHKVMALLFLFSKYCLIIDYLYSENLSHKVQINCTINYYFYLYLMFYTYVTRFDVTENLKFFTKLYKTKQGHILYLL
jgi:hypothetical protein